jgi:hypothetical protein
MSIARDTAPTPPHPTPGLAGFVSQLGSFLFMGLVGIVLLLHLELRSCENELDFARP